jgi:hypothetical protein
VQLSVETIAHYMIDARESPELTSALGLWKFLEICMMGEFF